MLGEGADYSQMILNLEKAGKLGNVKDLAKYPLYNSLKGIVDENNYQRAQVFEFKETKPKSKEIQQQKLEQHRAQFEERLSKKRLDEGTVTSLGQVQSLEQNLIEQPETERLLEGMEDVPDSGEDENLDVQVVRFQEEDGLEEAQNDSKIQIEFGEEEWTSQAFPFSETKARQTANDEGS
jgi:hypothetical protein